MRPAIIRPCRKRMCCSGVWEPVAHRSGISQMFPWVGELDQRAAVADNVVKSG